jgi:hypothetical protein
VLLLPEACGHVLWSTFQYLEAGTSWCMLKSPANRLMILNKHWQSQWHPAHSRCPRHPYTNLIRFHGVINEVQ